MPDMFTPADIQRKALSCYRRYLKSLTGVDGQDFFPAQITFQKFSAQGDYINLKEGVEALLKLAKPNVSSGPTVVLTATETRKFGRQSLPQRISFDSEHDLIMFVGKKTELIDFKANVELTRSILPELGPHLQRTSMLNSMLEYSEVWPDALRVGRFFVDHPRPDVYLRELPLDVDTKFVENHHKIIKAILKAILPEDAVAADAKNFADMFYLRRYPSLLRLRFLDAEMGRSIGVKFDDFALRIEDLSTLPVPPDTGVIIVENITSYFALPPLPNTIALFGGGHGVVLFKMVPWLKNARVFYWGDIDAQGLEILSNLRMVLGEVKNLFMNGEILEVFRALIRTGTPTVLKTTPGLAGPERVLYEYLVTKNVRLEQEQIPVPAIAQALAALVKT